MENRLKGIPNFFKQVICIFLVLRKLIIIVHITVPASSLHPLFRLPQNGRIVGGEDAKIEDVPYQVAMLRFGNSWCGGSIIRPDVVLTAAHCLYVEALLIIILYYAS
jgi:hypothetical protein